MIMLSLMLMLHNYPGELLIKYTTDAQKWANYLDRRLEFDEDGKLYTQLYDKCDDFPICYSQFSIFNL